jgi:hypothetical protein
MTRGTTPSLIIKFAEDVAFENVKLFYVTMKQTEYIKLTKKFEEGDPEIDMINKSLDINLTQEDTLKFADGVAELQVRGKYQDDTVFATKIYPITINRALYDEVI